MSTAFSFARPIRECVASLAHEYTRCGLRRALQPSVERSGLEGAVVHKVLCVQHEFEQNHVHFYVWPTVKQMELAGFDMLHTANQEVYVHRVLGMALESLKSREYALVERYLTAVRAEQECGVRLSLHVTDARVDEVCTLENSGERRAQLAAYLDALLCSLLPSEAASPTRIGHKLLQSVHMFVTSGRAYMALKLLQLMRALEHYPAEFTSRLDLRCRGTPLVSAEDERALLDAEAAVSAVPPLLATLGGSIVIGAVADHFGVRMDVEHMMRELFAGSSADLGARVEFLLSWATETCSESRTLDDFFTAQEAHVAAVRERKLKREAKGLPPDVPDPEGTPSQRKQRLTRASVARADLFVCAFPAAVCSLFLPLGKPIVVWTMIRIDRDYCDRMHLDEMVLGRADHANGAVERSETQRGFGEWMRFVADASRSTPQEGGGTTYRLKYSGRWPNCENIACVADAPWSQLTMEAKCTRTEDCTGFTFALLANSAELGQGCLKRCGTKEFGGYGTSDAEGLRYDYWMKVRPVQQRARVVVMTNNHYDTEYIKYFGGVALQV